MPAVKPQHDFVRWLPLAGLALVVAEIVAFWLVYLRSPPEATSLAVGVGTLFYAGKEAALPTALGFEHHPHPLVVGLFLFGADVAFTFFVYPPVHNALHRWTRRKDLVGRYLRQTQARAERHQGFVLRYGVGGLFLFMLIPFALNGPLVGAILGRLVGLPARQIIPTLVTAIAFTMAAWTTIYAFGLDFAATVHPALPTVIAASILSLVVAFMLVSFLRLAIQDRRERRQARPGLPRRGAPR